MAKRILSFLFAVACTFITLPALHAQSNEEEIASLHFIPGMSIPLFSDAGVYDIGGGGNLLARFTIPGLQILSFEGGIGFTLAPLKVAAGMPVTSSVLWVGAARLGVGLYFPLVPWLVVGASAHGGYYIGGFISDPPDNTSGSDPLLDAGLEINFKFSPYMSLGVGASYRMLFGLSNDLLVNLGVSYHFPIVKASALGPQSKPYSQLEISNVTLEDVFPVFYTYYSDHPLGGIQIRNNGKIPLENVKVQVRVGEYMDNATVCKEIPFITGGAKESVDLLALFNDKIMNITENTKLQVNITVESTVAGEKYGNELVRELVVYDRNAMTWSDDRRAAAFVTMKDPAVLKFSKNVSSYIQGNRFKALPKNLLTALAFFEALRKYGMSYAVDPTTPFTEKFKAKTAVDFLQFPRHTLEYKAGDCDDLSILYCALLESVGINSAFITVPGHIYAAVSLDLTPAEARRELASFGDLIVRGDSVWLPVEVTALSGGFLAAWQAGIKLWKEQDAQGQAHFIPLKDAWKEYDPAYLPGEGFTPTLPSEDVIVRAYLEELNKLIERDLFPQTKKLEGEIKADPKNQALANKLGVLYARYGVYDKAEAAFNRVPDKDGYAPTLVNLGNIAYLKNDLAGAKKYYDKAFAKNPNDPAVLLNLAKLAYEQGQYDKTDVYYGMLKKRDAVMAGKYAYLTMKGEGGDARAAQADAMKDQVAWGE
jgi:tetratricopeptide (TPR) repeat protein